MTLMWFQEAKSEFKNYSSVILIFLLLKVNDTRAVCLRLTPKPPRSLCILLAHMAFIWNWFVSGAVNAIHHENIRRLSPSSISLYPSPPSMPSFPSGSPFNQKKNKRQGKQSCTAPPLHQDNWNKCPFENKNACLIYRQCDSNAFSEAKTPPSQRPIHNG